MEASALLNLPNLAILVSRKFSFIIKPETFVNILELFDILVVLIELKFTLILSQIGSFNFVLSFSNFEPKKLFIPGARSKN